MVCEGDRSILKAKGDDMQCNINKPPRFSKRLSWDANES